MNANLQANRLMIVDDALIMRKRIAEIAASAGWEVVAEARDGEEAIEMYRREKPDLVTLDIVMPKLDGVSALKSIMHLDPDACVVMVSAVNQKPKLVECIEVGAMDFIIKPFEKSALHAFFEKTLDAQRHA